MAQVGISFNKFPEIAAHLHTALHEIMVETAFEVANNYTINAPRATGFMAESAYVSSTDGSTYGQGQAPPGDAYLLPEVTPSDDMEAVAGVAASYSGFVEMGTRFMAAQPAFYPAVETAKGFFNDKLAHIEERL